MACRRDGELRIRSLLTGMTVTLRAGAGDSGNKGPDEIAEVRRGVSRGAVKQILRAHTDGVSRLTRPAPHSPRHVLLALLPDLDIKQDRRVHPDPEVLLETVIPAPRGPGVGVERETERLAKVVQLQSG